MPNEKEQTNAVQEIDGRLHSINEIRDEAGKLISRVASPLRVEPIQALYRFNISEGLVASQLYPDHHTGVTLSTQLGLVRFMVGGANDTLVEPQGQRARELAARGIVFVPDFVANGGAAVALTGCDQEAGPGAVERAEAQVGATCARVLAQADREGVTPWEAAIRLAQASLDAGH